MVTCIIFALYKFDSRGVDVNIKIYRYIVCKMFFSCDQV